MSKQTAVEWLEQEFIALQNYGVNELGLFAKAKEMEKQQHELTCINVIERILDKKEKNEIIDSKQIFEDYYNETFKD